MHRKELIGNKNSFLLKVLFFVLLSLFSILIYLESHKVIDIVYFGVVFVLFIRFLYIKLYH